MNFSALSVGLALLLRFVSRMGTKWVEGVFNWSAIAGGQDSFYEARERNRVYFYAVMLFPDSLYCNLYFL